MNAKVEALLTPGRLDHDGPAVLAELDDPFPQFVANPASQVADIHAW